MRSKVLVEKILATSSIDLESPTSFIDFVVLVLLSIARNGTRPIWPFLDLKFDVIHSTFLYVVERPWHFAMTATIIYVRDSNYNAHRVTERAPSCKMAQQ